MNPEAEKYIVPQKPPEWWHEAIRNNMPGFLLQSYYFETFEEITPDGVDYKIQSFTKGCEAEGFLEGVFIIMTLTRGTDKNLDELIMPIITPVHELFKKQLSAVSPGENIYNRDPDPAYLGLMSKLDIKAGVLVKFIDLGNGKYTASLTPLTREDLVKDVRNKIINRYFNRISFFDRIKALNSTITPDSLKKIIVQEQGRLFSQSIRELETEGGFSETELGILRNDQATQKSYLELLKNIESTKTIDEYQNVNSAYSMLEPLLKAGFLDFYQRCCEKEYL